MLFPRNVFKVNGTNNVNFQGMLSISSERISRAIFTPHPRMDEGAFTRVWSMEECLNMNISFGVAPTQLKF